MIRVYPDLLTERKNVAAVFLRRGQFGSRAQRQVGKGRDFEKLRDYLPGDNADAVVFLPAFPAEECRVQPC